MNEKEIKSEILLITEKFKQQFSTKFDKSKSQDSLSTNVNLLSEIENKYVDELDSTKKEYFKENKIILKSVINKFTKICHKDFIDFATTFE